MTTGAIMMMVFAMLVLWGGLALAIVNLNRSKRPEPESLQREL